MIRSLHRQRGLLLLVALLVFLLAVPHASAAPSEPWVERLTIQYLRQQSYPGSAVAIEQTLSPGRGYTRHIASFESEGLKQYALLLQPAGQRPATGWPVIILNHGYIEPSAYRPTAAYEATMDMFARAGYVVFRPDLRGHGESEGEAENAFLSPGYTVDVLNAVASIKQYPAADPARIGMWGHSMGGWMTLRAMVVSPDIQAGVIWAGAVGTYEDMLTKWLPSLGSDGLIQPGAAPSQTGLKIALGATNPLWRTLSANYYLSDLSGPLQLHHGDADRNVPVTFSESVAAAGKDAGMPVELLTYRGDDHGLSRNFDRAMASTLAFFDKWLRQPLNLAEVKTSTVFAPGTVNLRAEPTTGSAVVGQMQQGERLPIIGANADRSWWLVETPKGRAWVAGRVTIAARTANVPTR